MVISEVKQKDIAAETSRDSIAAADTAAPIRAVNFPAFSGTAKVRIPVKIKISPG